MLVSDVAQLVIGQRYRVLRGSKKDRVRFKLTGIDGEFLSVIIDGETNVSQLKAKRCISRGLATQS